ncbi:hypothetical protein C8J56DRAFT_407750 [Mycena floridula]|nr:hypothetical protein C8J56DRAFT_407750 [Mycena floridula]
MGSSFFDSRIHIILEESPISPTWESVPMRMETLNCSRRLISTQEMGWTLTDDIQPLSGICRCGTAVPHFEMRPLRTVSQSRQWWRDNKVELFDDLRWRIMAKAKRFGDTDLSQDLRQELTQKLIILLTMNISESYIAELVLCSQERAAALVAGPQHQISMMGWQLRWKLESEEMSESLMGLGIPDHVQAIIMAEYTRLEQIYMQIQSYDAAEGVLARINARFGTVATDSAPLFLDSLGFTCHRQSEIVLSVTSQEHVDSEFLRSMRRITKFVDINLLEDE